MLPFVVAGGGFAGAETAAELHDFAETARRFYSSIQSDDVRIFLVHSGSRIMPEISAELADYALKKLRARGIEVLLNTRVSSAGSTWVELTNRPRIATKTLIWTAGVTPHPLLTTLPLARGPQNRLVVNEYLELPDHPGVWALGDSAEVPNRRTGEFCPPTAQHAIRQGKLVAENIAATIDLGSRRAFAYRPLGMLSPLGRRSAVAEICGIKFSGFFAWWLWRTIYLFKLPGLERKVRVALDWTLDLFFPRDIVLLKFFRRQAARDVPAVIEETVGSSR
jgi:NADH:quinone reductase (non-electrogenic)